MSKTIMKQLGEQNDLLLAKNQKLKKLLTDASFEIARYEGSLEARKNSLKEYPSLSYLIEEVEKDISRLKRLSLSIMDAIFDRN